MSILETILSIGFFVVLLVVLPVFIWRQTKTKGRWGLSPRRKLCPRCGTQMPLFRKPSDKEEMLWGGWTCPNCGCKMDKYGRERKAA